MAPPGSHRAGLGADYPEISQGSLSGWPDDSEISQNRSALPGGCPAGVTDATRSRRLPGGRHGKCPALTSSTTRITPPTGGSQQALPGCHTPSSYPAAMQELPGSGRIFGREGRKGRRQISKTQVLRGWQAPPGRCGGGVMWPSQRRQGERRVAVSAG